MARGGLKRLITSLEEEVATAVRQGADLIADRAIGSIMEGSVSGSQHVPSAPGEAPNNDLGDLVRGIEAQHPEPLRSVVISQSQAAASLEYGTSRMAARPYLGPAGASQTRNIVKLVQDAVARAARKANAS